MSPPPLCFRIAQAEDLPQIVAMLADDLVASEREASYGKVLAAHVSAFKAIEDDPNHELIVGTINAEVIAVLQLSYLPGLTYDGGWRAQIEGVRVARSEHSQGIGQQLIQHAIERARKKPCVLIQLTCDHRRARAQAFYVRLGFAPTHVGMKLRLRPDQLVKQS